MAHYCVNSNNERIIAATLVYYLYIRTLII